MRQSCLLRGVAGGLSVFAAGGLRLDACTRLLPKVAACNRVEGEGRWLPVIVQEETYGSCRPQDAAALAEHGAGVFDVDADRVALVAKLEAATADERSAAVSEVALKLRDAGVVRGWRDELVPVSRSFGADPVFLVERACYPLFGCKGYGVHVNGYVQDDELKLWVGRRSATKQTWPGLLDHLAAGHQPFGISPRENVIKEAGEEAGVPPELAAKAVSVGACSYRGVDEDGRLKNDCLFCYDLQLPSSFVPTPVDGEVEAFELKTVDQVLDAIEDDAFKPNVVLVIADFLIRKGVLQPEMPDYLRLVASLKQGDCA